MLYKFVDTILFIFLQLTWADLYFAALLDYLSFMVKSDLIEGYANLQAVKNNVYGIPAIKNWIETRPESEC